MIGLGSSPDQIDVDGACRWPGSDRVDGSLDQIDVDGADGTAVWTFMRLFHSIQRYDR
jgi:hypothetical protein